MALSPGLNQRDQVVVTVFVPADANVRDCSGAFALSLLSHLYVTVPAAFVVMSALKVKSILFPPASVHGPE